MIRPEKTKTIAVLLAAGSVLAACAGGAGPSERQLFEACMKGSMATEASCKCIAPEMKANLPPPVAQAMFLEMEGKKQEAAAIMDKMSFEQRAEFGMKQFEIVAKCLGAK